MKKLLIFPILFILSCSTEPVDKTIALPKVFPLLNNTGWVYEFNEFSSSLDYMLGANIDTTYLDTLIITETLEDYFLYDWLRAESQAVSLVKNENDKFITIGSINEGELNYYEKPYVWADYREPYDLVPTDTNLYSYPPSAERFIAIETFNNSDYYSYIYNWIDINEDDTYEVSSKYCKLGFLSMTMQYNSFENYSAIRINLIEVLSAVENNSLFELGKLEIVEGSRRVTQSNSYTNPFIFK